MLLSVLVVMHFRAEAGNVSQLAWQTWDNSITYMYISVQTPDHAPVCILTTSFSMGDGLRPSWMPT